MRRVDPQAATIHPMEPHRPVNPLPEIAVGDRHHLAVVLPLPAVAPPFGQTMPKPFADVAAGGDERDPGGLIEGLQSADHRQQFQPFAPHLGLEHRRRPRAPTRRPSSARIANGPVRQICRIRKAACNEASHASRSPPVTVVIQGQAGKAVPEEETGVIIHPDLPFRLTGSRAAVYPNLQVPTVADSPTHIGNADCLLYLVFRGSICKVRSVGSTAFGRWSDG